MFKKIILVVFIALVVFSAIYAISGKQTVTTSSDRAYEAYQTADALKKKLYYKEAITEYEKAIKLDTNFAMAYAELAYLHRDAGRKDLAKELIKKPISLFPLITEKEQLFIKTVEAWISEDHDLIRQAQDNYIKNFPDDVHSHIYIAERHMRERKFDKAIEEFNEIIDKDPGYALGYNMLGYLNYWNRNFDEALRFIKKYSMLAEKEANPHDSHGEILMNLGRYDEAIKAFETANKIKPDLVFVLDHLGDAYWNIGHYRDAIGYFERAKDNADNEERALSMDVKIAHVYHSAMKNEKSLKIIQDVLQQKGDFLTAKYLECILLAESGEFDRAEKILTVFDSVATAQEKSGIDLIEIPEQFLFIDQVIGKRKEKG